MDTRNQNAAVGMTASDDTQEIDLGELFGAIWARKKFVILLTLVGAALAFLITTTFIKPTYRSGFTAYVNNHSLYSSSSVDTINSSDTSASQNLVQTYAAIMKSRPVVEDAVKEAALPYSYREVSGCISTDIQSDIQLVVLNVTMKSPEEAKQLADAIADTAPDYIADIVEGSSMKIVAKPVLPDSKYSPSVKKNTVIGALIGLLLAVAVVVISELTDDRVKSADELEKKFGIPRMHGHANPACRCGDVLQGRCRPSDCPIFDNGCTPQHPVGACMVSNEGTCSAYYQYARW